MKREFPEVPLVGVGAVIIENDRVVLVKRAHPPLQAQWSIPGGVLEVGELVREAAVREAREETGLIVEPGELLGVYDRVLRDAEQRVQYHYVLIDFLCRRVAGELAPGSDADEVRWFTLEELPELKLAEDTVDVIYKGFAKVENRNTSRRINIADLDGRPFTLWLTDESNGSVVFSGIARWNGSALKIESKDRPAFEIRAEWHDRIQTITDEEVRKILLGADYFLRLFVGPVPNKTSLGEYLPTGLKWPE